MYREYRLIVIYIYLFIYFISPCFFFANNVASRLTAPVLSDIPETYARLYEVVLSSVAIDRDPRCSEQLGSHIV